jgi:hypothetical protein
MAMTKPTRRPAPSRGKGHGGRGGVVERGELLGVGRHEGAQRHAVGQGGGHGQCSCSHLDVLASERAAAHADRGALEHAPRVRVEVGAAEPREGPRERRDEAGGTGRRLHVDDRDAGPGAGGGDRAAPRLVGVGHDRERIGRDDDVGRATELGDHAVRIEFEGIALEHPHGAEPAPLCAATGDREHLGAAVDAEHATVRRDRGVQQRVVEARTAAEIEHALAGPGVEHPDRLDATDAVDRPLGRQHVVEARPRAVALA